VKLRTTPLAGIRDPDLQRELRAHARFVNQNADSQVTGPASSVDQHLVVFDGTTGRRLEDSGVTVGDLVPITRTINGEPLSANVTLTAAHVGADPAGTAVAAVAALSLANYTALRAYAGASERAYITGVGAGGMFVRDAADVTSADNAGTIIVDSSSRRWKRVYTGPLDIRWFGAVAGAASTAGIQAAIDAAFTLGAAVFIPTGTFLITGLTIYPNSHLIFDPQGLLRMTAAGHAIRTVQSPGASAPTAAIRRVKLDNPRIDMNANHGFAILLEGTLHAKVTNAEIDDIGTGTHVWNDGTFSGTYPDAGIALKGIHNIQGCYYNRIQCPNISGNGTGGGVGVWMGTSIGGSESRANFNRIVQPVISSLMTGIDLAIGGDNAIEQPELSLCATGVRLGDTTNFAGVISRRNKILQSYIEGNTTGIDLTTNAKDTLVYGFGSTSGTATPLNDNGVNTEYHPSNSDSIISGEARFYRYGVRFTTAVDNTDKETNVNTLDEYQEGTFTPALEGSVTPGVGTYTANGQKGTYTLIGNRCFFGIYLDWTAHTGTGTMRVTGLPFTSETGAVIGGGPPCTVYVSGVTLPANTVLTSVVGTNSQTVNLLAVAVGGGAGANVAMDTAGTLHISGHYLVNH
jgi:hypothetical protein